MVSVAHTQAEFEDIRAGFDAGYTHATHFYNAMPGFHKKNEYKYEGTVESIYLMDDMTVEAIADGIHVPPTILRLIYKVKGVEKTALITDALACAASDSQVAFDPRVIIEDGVCKLADRSALAGSIATMDKVVKVAVEAGIPFEDVIRMASETPAKMGTFSQYAYPHTLARYAELATALGVTGKTDEEKLEGLIKLIRDLKEKVGIKKNIAAYGIDEKTFLSTLDEMVEQAFDDQCTGANPRYPLLSEIKQMYLNAYYA